MPRTRADDTLTWIVVAGVLMCALALVGALTLLLPRPAFDRLVLPLVALAAGSLLGGALFHMLPASVAARGDGLTVWAGVGLGILADPTKDSGEPAETAARSWSASTDRC